ncbi:hypothetical protein Tco_0403315 [Tanacetum coccineum]
MFADSSEYYEPELVIKQLTARSDMDLKMVELAEVEEDDQERARFLGGKISMGRKKSLELNIGDSGNTEDRGKIVGGATGACSGVM